ncbi:hypothetical protein HK405_010508 [Cladochytrium tenue]|nr:hypothetical protein HK405_010508 [Cladochytrium tenue]
MRAFPPSLRVVRGGRVGVGVGVGAALLAAASCVTTSAASSRLDPGKSAGSGVMRGWPALGRRVLACEGGGRSSSSSPQQDQPPRTPELPETMAAGPGAPVRAVLRAQAGDCPHHAPGGGFVNPWPSARPSSTLEFLAAMPTAAATMPAAPREGEGVRVVRPDTARIAAFRAGEASGDEAAGGREPQMLLTWLGHAAFLLTCRGGPTVLLDPCLSERCSPLSFAGPRRMVPVPFSLGNNSGSASGGAGAELDQLPPVDVIVISHNHYDHLDIDVLRRVARPETVCFVPLGCGETVRAAGVQRVIECDWWDEYEVGPVTGGSARPLRVACTPCQHFSGRTLFDRDRTLWSSWVVSLMGEGDGGQDSASARFYFAGDTGYRTVKKGEDEDAVPTCPAFREIGEKYGPFDLAAIPIGAYQPRHLLSTVHLSPRDAVDVHLDVRSRRSVGMHWGTFVLTTEPVMEPPKLLREELKRRGIDLGDFVTLDVGESIAA